MEFNVVMGLLFCDITLVMEKQGTVECRYRKRSCHVTELLET
jgi:hypothetical protein